jgi:hypothetical protein
MSKLSTKNIPTGGEGVSKTLEPGTSLCKINNVSLEDFKFKEGGLNIMLHLEGEDLGAGFEGFFINKDRPELGRHKGKVGTVKATEWAFADGETKSGIPVKRDTEILKWLKQFCTSMGCLSWLDSQDEKHDTIQSMFVAFNKEKPYANKFFRFCIAGKEYTNRAGYSAYELFLPKYSKEGVPVEKDDVASPKLIKFNPSEHIKKKKVENVSEFGSPESKASDDFNL